MTTRLIVTSHPDVACDVCGRRLLRGERPDVFLGSGQRRMVCELCVPRATHEGWLRESEGHVLMTRAPAPRRARSLLGRRRPVPAVRHEEERASREPDPVVNVVPEVVSVPMSLTHGESPLERALALFNGSEHPRRIAGVARSLGAPSVRVAQAIGTESLMDVVVAWDLCWYRYRRDLDDEPTGVQLLAQGTELDELPPEDRVANAVADERGALSLN